MSATTLRVFCTSTITVHFVPIMTWKGLPVAHAAVLLSAAAFMALPAQMSFVYTWGGVIGPVAAGFLYDRTQNCSAILWTLVVVLAITSGAYATLTKPQSCRT